MQLDGEEMCFWVSQLFSVLAGIECEELVRLNEGWNSVSETSGRRPRKWLGLKLIFD